MQGSSNQVLNKFISTNDELTGEQVKCSIPEKDISCFVTKNVDINNYTKKIVNYQISKKIYNKPQHLNLCKTPNMTAAIPQDHVTASRKISQKPFKVNMKYFAEKNMTVDDIGH